MQDHHEKIALKVTIKARTRSPVHITPPPEVSGPPQPKGAATPTAKILIGGRRVPYVPGTTMRGLLRRSVSDVMVARTGERYSYDGFAYNRVGGVRSDDKVKPRDLNYVRDVRRRNPIVGLFGDGVDFHHSHCRVSNLVPVDPASVSTDETGSVRTDDVQRDPAVLEDVDDSFLAEYERRTSLAREKTRLSSDVERLKKDRRKVDKADKEALAAVDAEIEALKARMAEVDADRGNVNQVQMIMRSESMPMGTDLSGSLDCPSVTRAEAGLLLAGVMARPTSPKPFVGGMLARGYGDIEFVHEVSVREKGGSMVHVGTITTRPMDDPDVEDPEGRLAGLLASLDAYVASGECDLRDPAEIAKAEEKAAKAAKGAANDASGRKAGKGKAA